jgi:methylenetetrahydrofolate dehydrogenase (NAD+)
MASSTTNAVPPSCKVVLAKNIANGLLDEVKDGLKSLEKGPNLMGFLANHDPAARMYADWTEKTCHEK